MLDINGRLMGALLSNAIRKAQRQQWIVAVEEAVKRVGKKISKCNLTRDKRWNEKAKRLG